MLTLQKNYNKYMLDIQHNHVSVWFHWIGVCVFHPITEVKEPWAWLVLGWVTVLLVAANVWSAPSVHHCHLGGMSTQEVS